MNIPAAPGSRWVVQTSRCAGSRHPRSCHRFPESGRSRSNRHAACSAGSFREVHLFEKRGPARVLVQPIQSSIGENRGPLRFPRGNRLVEPRERLVRVAEPRVNAREIRRITAGPWS